MTDEPPLILLPGMGADGRMFSAIRELLPQTATPSWIPPEPGESVASYARRFAKVVDSGQPFFLGGASFGGVVALELSALLPNVQACFIIGSIRTDGSRPRSLHLFRPLTPFVGILPSVSPVIIRSLGKLLRAPTREVMTELADADPAFLRWGTQAILNWKPSPETADVRVFQIHGETDRVFPVGRTSADQTVPGAGHLVAITHPQPVADFLRNKMAEVAEQAA